MVKTGEPLPDRVKHPLKDLKIKVATCQAIAMARRYGWVLAVGDEDISCPLTAVVFGFRHASEFYLKGRACAGMYTETEEAGTLSEEQVEKFSFGEYEYILVAPLHRTTFEPEVIVIYANPAQVLRLLTGALWKSGGRLASSFGGRIDCAEEIIVPLRSGKCEVILPCYGDRIFAQTQDHEMAFSIPMDRAEEVIEGLEGTHKGGVRYPIPSFLRYTGEFPEHYRKVEE
ncbi:MAG: DUF169 domain-containing protein [Deltaproteobacteria bacterium]|nr:MAG: DUF169 domain-containing protein [Deltaproteobacteria bacterium]